MLSSLVLAQAPCLSPCMSSGRGGRGVSSGRDTNRGKIVTEEGGIHQRHLQILCTGSTCLPPVFPHNHIYPVFLQESYLQDEVPNFGSV